MLLAITELGEQQNTLNVTNDYANKHKNKL